MDDLPAPPEGGGMPIEKGAETSQAPPVEEETQTPAEVLGRSGAVSPTHEERARRIEEAFGQDQEPEQGERREEEVPLEPPKKSLAPNQPTQEAPSPEEEAAVVPPESRGPEEAEKLPTKDDLKDLPEEAKETGAEVARGLTAPESPEVQTDPQVVKSQEEASSVTVPPRTFEAIARARQREEERAEAQEKAA